MTPEMWREEWRNARDHPLYSAEHPLDCRCPEHARDEADASDGEEP